MPNTLVGSKWSGGDLIFHNKTTGTAILTIKAAGGVIVGTTTLSEAELAFLDGVTAGTAAASKAAVLGANKNLDELHLAALYLGAGAGTQITPTAAQINLLTQGVAAGYKIARGIHTTVAAVDTVVTGLATVVAIVATLESDPTLDPDLVTASIGNQAGAPAAGSVYIKTWKRVGAGDATPAAATTFVKTVNWVAIGT